MPPIRKPLSDAERASLLREVDRQPKWGDAVMGGVMATLLVLGVVMAIAWLVDAEDWGRRPMIALAIPFGAGALVTAWLARADIARHVPAREHARRLLAAGEVDGDDVVIKDAIEVAEQKDEGPHFFVQLADGRVLFLSGE